MRSFEGIAYPRFELRHGRRTNAGRDELHAVAAPVASEVRVSHAVRLRVATASDVPALTDLIARSARALSQGYYTADEIESAIHYVFGVDTTLIADGTYYVAESGGRMAGCGGWSRRHTMYGGDQRPVGSSSPLGTVSETFLDPGRDAARIRAFFVAPEAARRGVGRCLFDRSVEAAREAGFRRLELMATLPGVPFYEALGFEVVRHVTDVLPDGAALHFVSMRRTI
jgi:GNAT superfamily N-acetyltransferase